MVCMSRPLRKASSMIPSSEKSRHKPQFNLRVVGRKEQTAGIGDKGPPDFPSLIVTHRDILQIGCRRRYPAGGGHRLIIVGVHLARFRIYGRRERLKISCQQFPQGAGIPLSFQPRDASEPVFEYILTCGVLPRLGLPGLRVEFQTVEKNFPTFAGDPMLKRSPTSE